MANHPNRGWRGKWTVDPSTQCVQHKSGLIVRLDNLTDDPQTSDGTALVVPEELQPITKKNLARLTRLMREACDIYFERMEK